MAEFVPERIYRVNKEGPAVSTGTLLYADISGFTRMSEKLATLGPAGTEELTTILNDYFGKMLDIIKEHDGEVLKIIGDAIVAAFYEKDLETGKKCAESMLKATQEYKKIKTTIGEFELGAKITGISGKWIEFIAGDRRSADLFLAGETIKHLATMEKNAKKGELFFEKPEELPSPNIDKVNFTPFPEFSFYDKNISSLVNLGIKGEHRVITSLFLYFAGYDENNPDLKAINSFLTKIFSIIERYHGRLHIIDNLTEEGAKMLFLFGVPRSYGNDIMNATQALLEISKINSEFAVKAAVNTGFGYAGIITGEKMNFYTTIGDAVNTAARLAESAKWGEFVTSFDVYRSTFHKVAFKEKDAVVVKGKEGPQRRFTPLRIRKEIEERFPFVGRENLLSDLGLYLEKTDAVIMVEGEPGSGKTRLLREFFKRLSTKNLILMRFDHTKPSFSAFREMFAREAGILETDSPVVIKEKLHDLLVKTDIYDGELLKREEFIGTFLFNLKYESGVYESVSPRIRWQNLEDAIKLFFKYRSVEAPLFIWADDLHEASKEEEELIIYVLRAIYADGEHKNIRFFFSRRDVSKVPFPSEIPVKTVRVEPLTYKETSKMLDAIFKKPAHDELYEEIYRKTEGIPFFVEQYALLLMEKGLLREKDGKYFIPEHAREVMPENIFTVIMERVDRLEEKIKEKLRIGSVIGMKFPKKPLYIISNDSALEQELETIANEHLAYPDEGELEEIEYIFSHAYLRDVIYRSILIKKKKELHREIARVFEEIYTDKIEQLYDIIARHYHSGSDVKKALKYYVLAAKRARNLFNNSLAYEDFKRAEEIINNYLPDNKETLYEIYMELAGLSRLMGKPNEINEYLELAIKTAKELKDREKELNARIDLIEAHLYSGKGDELSKEIEEIINETQDKNLKNILARAHLVKTEILTYRGEYKEAISSAEAGIKLFSELNNPLKLAYSYKNRGLAYKESGDIEKALWDYKAAYEIFKKENYLLGIAGMNNNLGTIYFSLGDFKNALSHFQEAYRIWKNIGDVENSAGILINIGACYESLDEREAAMKSYEESLKTFKEMGHLHGISILTFNMGHLKVRENKIGEALSLFKEAFEIREKIGNNPGLVNVGKLIVEYLAFLGDAPGALNYFYKMEKAAKAFNAPEAMAIISELKVKLMREGIIHLDIPLETSLAEKNLEKTTGDYMARYIYALMVLKMMQGMKKESEELYNKALNIKDASEEILWYLKREYGLLLTLNGNSEQAVKHYIKLKELPINTIEKIKINTELYRVTGNTEYLDEAKRDILTLLLNLPDNLKKTFVNKPGIKKILKA